MENASKALLIAGGILLGLLTLSALVYMFSNISEMQRSEEVRQEEEHLAEWNAEWEAYNKQLLYGAEVLTVINKAEQNNADYEDSDYKVEVTVDDSVANGNPDIKAYVKLKNTSIFTCEKVEYNTETGRVNKMVFKLDN